jgi:hypothetical protein
MQRPGSPGWGLGVGLTTLPCKKENHCEASKKFSRILRRRPKPTLGCGAKERKIIGKQGILAIYPIICNYRLSSLCISVKRYQ